ncbi:hypothetical protein BH20ACT21_BH20ACT21_21960 [soil metagenome]|jgi:hypothetical protein|nr:hypothetical protein [Actinomycetota bacterium]
MTGAVEQAVISTWAYSPRPAFSAELLDALRRAAGLRLLPPAAPGHERWVLAGSIAGVATAASAAVYGFVKLNRKGSAA